MTKVCSHSSNPIIYQLTRYNAKLSWANISLGLLQ